MVPIYLDTRPSGQEYPLRKIAGSRLAPYGWGTAQLTLTGLLWQASIGVLMLALVQQCRRNARMNSSKRGLLLLAGLRLLQAADWP